jgi:hypothetical protein
MLKKVVFGLLVVGLIGILAAGAVTRTLAKTGDEEGYGRGQGSGQSVANSRGDITRDGDQTGTGQAEVDEWLTLSGTVTSADADLLVVETAGGEVAVENRGWWYAQEQGFTVQVGDELVLTGFYENEDFEVGQIEDLTSGQTVTLRDETGRPMWAGRGRRGG